MEQQGSGTHPETEFLDTKFNKRLDSFAPSYLKSFYWRIFSIKKPDSALILEIHKKIRETRTLEYRIL
jgi:hypothetical protein